MSRQLIRRLRGRWDGLSSSRSVRPRLCGAIRAPSLRPTRCLLRLRAALLVLCASSFGFAMLALGAPTALAIGTLDQQNPGPQTGAQLFASDNNGNPARYEVAQTFTAGATGSLDTVKLNVWNATGAFQGGTGDLIVRIEAVAALSNPRLPDDNQVLASQTIPNSDVSTDPNVLQTVTFDDPASVLSGTQYAIVLPTTLGNFFAGPPPVGSYDEWGTTGSNYAGGAFCSGSGGWTCDSTTDAIFTTYVTPPPPAVGLSTSSLGFGDQPLGSSSSAQTVTVTNTAANGAQSLALGQLSTSGTNAGDFTIGSDHCSNQSVAPGNSCTIGVSFAPTGTGSRTASLIVPSNAASSPDSVSLSGSGTTLADVKVSMTGPTSVSKGAQATYTITVSNAGPSTAHNVVLTSAVPAGAWFLGVTTTRGTCAHPSSGASKGTISCSLGDLASGGNVGAAVSLKVSAKAGSTITDVASAYSTADGAGAATPDPNTSNNWVSENTTVTK